jgi:Tfp pilus assembly protein PilN
MARGARLVTHQPDFSTAPRPSRLPVWETLAVGAAFVVLILAGGGAWRARQEARQARARLGDVRREVEAASARLGALEARSRGNTRALPAVEAPPSRIVANVASALPGDARLERLSIDYERGGALEMEVVARDAASWDRLLDRLGRASWLRDLEPGPEAREAEVRSLVRARWAGGQP